MNILFYLLVSNLKLKRKVKLFLSVINSDFLEGHTDSFALIFSFSIQ